MHMAFRVHLLVVYKRHIKLQISHLVREWRQLEIENRLPNIYIAIIIANYKINVHVR